MAGVAHMQFARVSDLIDRTQASDLCAAWGTSLTDVQACKNGDRPVTVREAGALAEMHGLTLLDILSL